MIRTVIIDDEYRNISILKAVVSKFCPELQVIADARDAREGFEIISLHKPDLLFLDIEMPYGNAFDLLDKLMPIDFEVIFVTAFNEYALKAFRYSAIDYLLKPVSIVELKKSVERAVKRINDREANDNLKNLMHNFRAQTDIGKKIAIPNKEGMVFIPVADIIRCEASGSYTNLFLKGVGKVVSSKSIKEYEDLLPTALFFRVHHSHIINMGEIKKYHRGRGGEVEMTDGVKIDVAVRRKDEFLARLE
ncbi:MAG: response regulator transcription factor [Bacteroidetes bacterium]|nr:response regulator transcription factor [Bacteroidota bacterium]